MSRKNRIVIPNSVFHLTARVVNRAFLLADPAFKDWIVERIYGIADFCGVDVLAWCVMDNHFHLLAHVPEVPEKYWTSSKTPASYAFGMRPPECNPPLWSPDNMHAPAKNGPCQSAAANTPHVAVGNSSGGSVGNGPDGDNPRGPTPQPRPPTGFMLDDEEMLKRLRALYGGRKAGTYRRRWERLRKEGRDREVELEKESFCRRMYNVSQYMKTLKETIAEHFNRERKREGQLWDGRFHSGVVERTVGVQCVVASYIDFNPVRAKIVTEPGRYRWDSFSMALSDGPYARRCRRGYETLLGLEWPAARELFGRILNDRVVRMGMADGASMRASQAIRQRIRVFSRGAFIGIGEAFGHAVLAFLPRRYPAAKPDRDIAECRRLDWSLPPPKAA